MVYIKSLGKNIFPNYLPPYQDELFSSWLCRLSHNHRVKSNVFLKNYIHNREINLWNRDIDLFAPEYLKKMIVDHTPLSIMEVNNLFIAKHKGKAFAHVAAHTKNVLPIGVHHRQRIRFGQQCCILCLRESTPYYKTSWRLVTSVICVKHKCLLIDRCQNCQSSIAFFRSEFGESQSNVDFNPELLFNCFHCKLPIKDFIPEQVCDRDIEFQMRINNMISTGIYKKESSISHLNALFILSKRVISNTKDNRFRKAIIETFKVDTPVNDLTMNFWDVKGRCVIFTFIDCLLHEQFDTLCSIFKRYRIIKSCMTKNYNETPKYLENLYFSPSVRK